jgi:hypothetical protein
MAVKGIASLPSGNLGQVLFAGRGLNFQLTSDQALTKIYSGTNYYPAFIIARQRSGGASVACVGGVYDGAGKTGNIIVLAAQSWVTLAVGILVTAPINVGAATLLSATPIFSLTTGSTAACTGDVLIYGYDIS